MKANSDPNRNSQASEKYVFTDAIVHDLNENSYMLDTDTCSYIIKNRPSKVRTHFRKILNQGICISDITLAELFYGLENKPYNPKFLMALLSFISLVKVIPFGLAAAEDYGKIRSYLRQNGTPIGPIDTLIAAHARSTNLILVTNNIRHFSLIPNLLLENWAE